VFRNHESRGERGAPAQGVRQGDVRGKYFPFTTFRRLIAHTRLTLSFLSQEGVFAFAKLKGVKTIRLRVETSNTGAIGLYRNLGFAQDRNRGIKNCYGPGRDAAVFEYTVG
jgi:hypothetical protein|tara:strand:- start:846 stop:1178 length:333 start_codon:yes stop_codon:yes gene_type:complete